MQLEYAFNDCSNITSITIPESVASIGYGAFSGCTGLTSVKYMKEVQGVYKYENGTLTIQNDGMADSPQWYKDNINPLMLNVVFSGSETSIGKEAFSGCCSLKSITIPNSVTSIGYCAFSGCSNLTEIIIPKNVTKIGGDTFYGCEKLTVYCEIAFWPKTWDDSWESWKKSIYNVYLNTYDTFTVTIKVYWYRDIQPTESGNYWHYVDGVVTKW